MVRVLMMKMLKMKVPSAGEFGKVEIFKGLCVILTLYLLFKFTVDGNRDSLIGEIGLVEMKLIQ